MAARALVISRRSMAAIRRPNRLPDEARGSDAVFDILGLSCRRWDIASCSSAHLGIPDTSNNAFVCMAAYCRLQCNIDETIGIPNNKAAAGNRRPLECWSPLRLKTLYSAATL